MEDYWLGTWKYLLLGIWPSSDYLDSIQKSLSQEEMNLMQLVVKNKCYVGLRSEATSGSSNQFEKVMQLLFRRLLELSDDADNVECINMKPIILVLDSEVQVCSCFTSFVCVCFPKDLFCYSKCEEGCVELLIDD